MFSLLPIYVFFHFFRWRKKTAAPWHPRQTYIIHKRKNALGFCLPLCSISFLCVHDILFFVAFFPESHWENRRKTGVAVIIACSFITTPEPQCECWGYHCATGEWPSYDGPLFIYVLIECYAFVEQEIRTSCSTSKFWQRIRKIPWLSAAGGQVRDSVMNHARCGESGGYRNDGHRWVTQVTATFYDEHSIRTYSISQNHATICRNKTFSM